MNHEPIIAELRAARAAAGLSQRELSGRTGITQSNISLLESGSVAPAFASVIQIARALDLELVLVPKKLVPAVHGIIRANSPNMELTPEFGSLALKELQRGERLVRKLALLSGPSSDLTRIETTLKDMRRLNLSQGEVRAITDALNMLKRYQASPQAASVVREVADALRRLRNAVVHPQPEVPRPAYGSEEEDDDA